MVSKLLPFALLTNVYANPLVSRDLTLGDDCTPCSPSGTTGFDSPAVSNNLTSLYIDLLASVKDIHFRKRWADANSMKRTDRLCCAATLDCVNLQNFNIPMCYDKFTTNYAFADGSFGSLTTGEYDYHDGSKANLLTGDYTNSTGETGNIYSDDESSKPNTATLSIPPQWTGTGLGSAIPPTAIASFGPVVTTDPSITTTANSTGSSTASDTHNTGFASAQNTAPTASVSRGATVISVSLPMSFQKSFMAALLYAIYTL